MTKYLNNEASVTYFEPSLQQLCFEVIYISPLLLNDETQVIIFNMKVLLYYVQDMALFSVFLSLIGV